MLVNRMLGRFNLLLSILALILVLTGCQGGPAFMRGAALRPIPDSWFPLFSRHYAVSQSDGLQLKATGYVHHLSLNFDTIIIVNGSDDILMFCENCAKWSVYNNDSSLREVSLATLKGQEYIYDDKNRAFVISPGSSVKFCGVGRFARLHEPESPQIRLELQFTDLVGNKKKLYCDFVCPCVSLTCRIPDSTPVKKIRLQRIRPRFPGDGAAERGQSYGHHDLGNLGL